jgi:polysaccharide biosynthesis transport protein
MAATNPRQITPRGVARNLFRYRRRMALVFFGVMLLTLVAIALYPRSYTSESKLFIRVGRESVALDPTATTGQTIMLQKTQVDEVNSALQLFLSREVMQRAVERVGAERIVKDGKTTGAADSNETATSTWSDSLSRAASWIASQTTQTMAALRLADPGTPEEVAIRKLESGLKAFAPKDSTVITVTYSAASPQLAHDVVEAVTNVFLDEHLRVNHTEGSQAFFAEQAESLQKQLTTAQDSLRDRKNKFGISTVESRRTVFAEQLKDIELQLLSTERELAYSNAEIADLTRAIDSLQPELVTNRVNGFANEGKDLMRAKLYELEIEESKLRSRYSEGHPLLEQIQQQRKEAEALLKDMPNDRTQTTAALNPNQRQLELDLLQAKAKKEAQQARLAAAQKQRDELNTQLKELNDHEVQIGDLERNVQILDGKYRMHVEKLEQARLNDALGRDGIQNVKVAQAATLVGKPTSPKKPLLLALGFVIALGAAVAMPFLAEVFDETLRSADEVETELGLPVLLSFPYQKLPKRIGKVTGRREPAAGAQGSFRALAHQLLSHNGHNNGHPPAKAVGVVGCEIGASRSSVAAELAIQAAECGAAPVLLIDGDERYRNVAEQFGLNGSPGWREVLAGTADAQACVHAANDGRLAVMTSGQTPASHQAPAPGGDNQLNELKQKYGLVVIDLPSTNLIETRAAAGWLDESLLVVEAEQTRIQSAQRAKALLERAGIRVTGVVLANQRQYVPRWLYDRL